MPQAPAHGTSSNARHWPGSVVQAPRAWWRYAVLRVVRESRRACGWRLHAGFFEERRAMRLRYIELYKRSQARGKPLSESELTELQQLEHSALSVEDVVHFRSRAQLQLHAEGGGHERGDGAARDERAQTWWGWVTGAEVAEVPKAVDVGGEIALTPEQRAMLSALLAPPEESAAAAAAGEAAADCVSSGIAARRSACERHGAAAESARIGVVEHEAWDVAAGIRERHAERALHPRHLVVHKRARSGQQQRECREAEPATQPVDAGLGEWYRCEAGREHLAHEARHLRAVPVWWSAM